MSREWRPDVIVCDETDFGAMVAAERLHLPYASVVVIAAGSFVRPEVVAEPLNALRAAHGLDPDPELEMLSRHLVLSPVPPSFRDPAYPLPPTGHVLRPTDPELGLHDRPPRWLDEPRTAPLVYVTLGTVFNTESGDLFDRVLTGLHGLPVEVVVTVGRELDPALLGPQPASVHVETYVPQSLLLARCELLLCHGGSGSVLGSLTHGVPVIVMPMGADQPANAARCETLGVGRALDATAATPSDVRDAVVAVLSSASYRSAAERVRAEVAALPGPEHAIDLLESLISP